MIKISRYDVLGAALGTLIVICVALILEAARRADALAGCTEGSHADAEPKAIVDLIEAYEAKRWPLGLA